MIPEGDSSCASNTKLISAAHPCPVQTFVSFSLWFISLSAFQKGAGAHLSQMLLRTGVIVHHWALSPWHVVPPAHLRWAVAAAMAEKPWRAIRALTLSKSQLKPHCTEQTPEFSRGCSVPWATVNPLWHGYFAAVHPLLSSNSGVGMVEKETQQEALLGVISYSHL